CLIVCPPAVYNSLTTAQKPLAIVLTNNASTNLLGLTIEAVAQAAGISKGGVQSCFGTKAALIDALFERFGHAYDARYRALVDHDPTPLAKVRAHVEATFCSDEVSSAKAAGLLAALLQSPQDLDSTRAWYQERLAGLSLDDPEQRQAWLAFLATEGAFMLRYFGLVHIEDRVWGILQAELLRALSASGSVS
ncbi:MAG: TetR family transcriptional regulator, partial [Azovibrio sp.]|nr:TetR family transcriptional regulator [Azovibrio sp.]